MREATAFSPGHITGLFQICRHRDVMRTGSRGAGFSIALGASSRVTVRKGLGRCTVKIDGAPAEAPVTHAAISHLLGGAPLDVRVETELQLPLSQGFGMSAAGVLSASLALVEALEKERKEAFIAAHLAEVHCGSGLGDVAGIMCAGVELRSKEGLPPFGEVERIQGDFELILAQVGPCIETSSVIMDREREERINAAGRRCLSQLRKRPEVGSLFSLSARFAEESGLIGERVKEALSAIADLGRGSMCMIGNSVFVTGDDLDMIEVALRPFGKTYRAHLDHAGAKLL